MTGPQDYGERYWCVRTRQATDGELYFHADTVDVTPSGALDARGKRGHTVVLLAAGQWQAVFAASVIDGRPVAVEHGAELPAAKNKGRRRKAKSIFDD